MTEDIKQTVGQTINSTLNSAVDTGSEAIRNGLNSMFGSGNSEYHNKTKEFEERRRREREQERKKQEEEKAKERMLTLYDRNTGGRMKGMMLAISGGILPVAWDLAHWFCLFSVQWDI